MTSGRRPAGAPDESPRPAGAPAEVPRRRQGASADEEAARVDSDLDALLDDVKRERDEYLDLARRARADFENYRKRSAREAAEAERRGKSALARELVPALDNLERALRSAGVDPDRGETPPSEPESREVSAHEALAEGVALVLRELRGTLGRAGVESFDPTGERFDPSRHEALATRAADGADSGVVVETLEKGYRLDEQLIRPARVVVSS
jgi:molecular chaperone GrpE